VKNKSASHLVLTGLFVVLLLAASNSIGRAQECPGTATWVGGIGDWFVGTNWSPSGCVPTETVDAFINNGGTAQILAGTATAESVHLGENQGDSGSAKVAGASTILYPGTIYVGNRGIGNLSIGNGGHLNGRYAYVAPLLNLGSPNSNGIVNVKGSGAVLRVYDSIDNPGAGLFIGCTATSQGVGGTATVNVSDGGSIIVYRAGSNDPGVTVGLSGTLTGNGILFMDLGVPSSKTVKVFGTLAPGKSLTINGNLDLAPETNTASTVCQVNPQVTPQPNDKVYVSSLGGGGNAYLGGRLTVVMSGTFTAGMGFNLLHADTSRIGFFQHESIISLSPLGGCLTPRIEYTAHDVNLLIVNTCAEELEEP
jgi:T5SS/PEP-CTERM-associated repeat protein